MSKPTTDQRDDAQDYQWQRDRADEFKLLMREKTPQYARRVSGSRGKTPESYRLHFDEFLASPAL